MLGEQQGPQTGLQALQRLLQGEQHMQHPWLQLQQLTHHGLCTLLLLPT